jgi:predicted DsbA family dithiol-disulfide isomerase
MNAWSGLPISFDAHRLIWLAEKQGAQDAVTEGLFADYFTNGRDVGDRPVLTDIAVQAGLNRAKVEVLLAGTKAPKRSVNPRERRIKVAFLAYPQ